MGGGLLAIAKLLPGWLWIVLAVVAWGAWQRTRATAATAKVQQVQRDQLEHRIRTHEQRETALQESLAVVEARLAAQQEAAKNAERRRVQAAAAAASAADALRMLEHDARAAAAGACGGDPAAAADGPAGQLADALRDSAARYLEVARVADDAIIRGGECEQRYDALTQQQAQGALTGPR